MIRLFSLLFLWLSLSLADDNIISSPSNPLSPPFPPPVINNNQNKSPFKPSIAIIIGVFTTIFSVTFLILLYVKHCKRVNNNDYPNNNSIAAYSARKNSGIDRNVVDLLPVFRFGSLRGQKDGLECAVCLTKFEPSEVLRLLPKCKHAFHVECVDTWLDAHSTCPLCRYRVDPEDVLLIEDNKILHQEDHAQKLQEEETMEIRRISGRHSSAGERGSNGCLQVVVEKPPQESSSSSRRSLDSSMRPKKEASGPVSIGCFERSRKDGLLLAGKEDSRKSMDRRFEHRIVVSSSGSQERWSDVRPSDLLYLRSEMIISDSRRFSGSSSRPSVTTANSGQRQRGLGLEGGGGIDESGRSVINGRSVSEITGMSRGSSNERRRQERQRQEEGFVSRWKAWISDTNKSPRHHHRHQPSASAPDGSLTEQPASGSSV